ncbi:MAG: GntR family transcriptional regulator [Planctomycetota bacterium]|nr:MAG: GntR family transcriptional regulator [Planctomycetota bacterium]
MSDTPPVNGSLREQAYSRLRRLLILQQVPEGQRLRETEWAKRLGVNRTALREAFARLEAEGFIELGAKTGYFVPHLTNKDVLEIIEVRILLEGGAIDRLIQTKRNVPRYLKPMLEACEQLERLVQEDYVLGVAEADRRFHEALIYASGNKRLLFLYQRAPLPIIHPEIISGEQWEARVRKTYQEHRKILEAITNSNADEAKELLHTHLNERAYIPLLAG